MGNEWIQRQVNFLTDNLSNLSVEPERLVTTSRKILDISSVKNVSQVVIAVHKSVKSAQAVTSWTDSGT